MVLTLQVHGGGEHGRAMVLVPGGGHDPALAATGQVMTHGGSPGVVGARHGGGSRGVPVAHLGT